ncbi:MAG: hypothetical protein IPH77_05700 [Ignavibacteria bacterium]|nr:hypothetical protein [Ignavibacteria bacterium]
MILKVFIPNSYDTLFSARQIKKYFSRFCSSKEVFTECYGLEGWNNTIHGEAENVCSEYTSGISIFSFFRNIVLQKVFLHSRNLRQIPNNKQMNQNEDKLN